jgi:hypothetical protein
MAPGEGEHVLVCGLAAWQRALFLETMLQFGPPHIRRQPHDAWQPFRSALPGVAMPMVGGGGHSPALLLLLVLPVVVLPVVVLPSACAVASWLATPPCASESTAPPAPHCPARPPQLKSYMLVLLEHLDDCAASEASTHNAVDRLPHNLLLRTTKQAVALTEVWERVAALHLLSVKLAEAGSQSALTFKLTSSTGLYAPSAIKGHSRLGWGMPEDRLLLLAIFKHG